MAIKTLRSHEVEILRQALRDLPEGAAHSAVSPPEFGEVYTPDSHEAALDPNRALVVGNRGTGKSFWSAVLADENLRKRVAEHYPRLRLQETAVKLGFHENAGKTEDAAPSPQMLASMLKQHRPEQIWQAVLLKALGPATGLAVPSSLGERLTWMQSNLETVEAGLRRADTQYRDNQTRFLLVFDALDRLGTTWDDIRTLSRGLLRFALDLRGYRAIRAKIWLRLDQWHDTDLFRFPDSSKLRAEYVKLEWQISDVYGLLFQLLWTHKDPSVQAAFRRAVDFRALAGSDDREMFPRELKSHEIVQANVFSTIAGPYMGSSYRRGKTFAWMFNHLADGFRETSPRSFLVAVQRAAATVGEHVETVFDHHAIRIGVQEASSIRLDQLREDYPWIDRVLEPLERLEVPCLPQKFIANWRKGKTIDNVRSLNELGPIELENVKESEVEEALLNALANIGVLERRPDGKINIPDIFRVAARMKRRGGVKPLPRR